MKKTTLILMSLLMMILLGSVYTWSVFRIPVEEYYEVNTFLSGLPYMISLVFYALAMVITGRYLTFMSIKRIAFMGVFFIFFGWMMAGFTTSIIGLIIVYGVFIGIGVGMLYGIPIMIIQSLFKQNSGFYTGLVLGGFGLSPLVTAPFIRSLLTNLSLHESFMIMGGFTFIILLLITMKLMTVEKHKEPTIKQLSSVKLDKQFIILYVLFLLGTSIGLMMIGLSYQVGVKYYEFSPTNVTIAMTIFALANGMSRLLFGYLSDRFSLNRIIYLVLLILIFSGIVAYLNNGNYFALYLLSFTGFWFILGSWLAIAPNAIKTLYGLDNYSKRYGVLFTAYGLGAIIGVSLSGLILDALKATQVLYIMIIVIALASFLLVKANHLSSKLK
ncbi:MAG: MFS transporter [Candidatus Izemoplasmatales bacterium]